MRKAFRNHEPNKANALEKDDGFGGVPAHSSEMINNDELTESIIGCAIEVHRTLGPGLLESTYEECLAVELGLAGLRFQRQLALPLRYKSLNLANGYRCDFIIESEVILEIKAIETILRVHDAQVKTYLKLSGMNTGLLINFNSVPLKDGIHRHSRRAVITDQ